MCAARFWALFTKTAVRNMPLSGKARLLLAAALLQRQGADAFLAKCFHPPPATHAALLQRQGADALLGKCFHTHTATHAAYAPNTTPVDITALNTTQSDCVELVRVRPSRVPICNMLSEPVVQLGALVTARVLLQCSLVVYKAVRLINDDEFKQYFIIWEDGWGCRAEAATLGLRAGSAYLPCGPCVRMSASCFKRLQCTIQIPFGCVPCWHPSGALILTGICSWSTPLLCCSH